MFGDAEDLSGRWLAEAAGHWLGQRVRHVSDRFVGIRRGEACLDQAVAVAARPRPPISLHQVQKSEHLVFWLSVSHVLLHQVDRSGEGIRRSDRRGGTSPCNEVVRSGCCRGFEISRGWRS